MGRGGQLRIGLDATPLLGPRTGIGRYVDSLLRALARRAAEDGGSTELAAVAVTLRGRATLPQLLPAGVRTAGPPMPARLLHRAWRRLSVPTVTSLAGRMDVFHGTNFVLPPTGRAAGVVTVHDLSFLRTPHTVTAASRAFADLVPRSLRRAAVVLTPSAAVAAEIAETYRIGKDRLVVTPLGVDSAWFDAAPPDAPLRESLGLPERYFLFAGNLEPRKNLPLLLAAYREVLGADPDAPPLVLAGPPGWGPALDTTGIPPARLHFLGYVEDAALRRVVAGATALVYPSAYEGFGLPPLEAFACGVPVIAADLPVVEEVLGPDRSLAARVPAGDRDRLAEALLARASSADPPGAAEARRARARNFDWDATAAATQSAYSIAVA